MNRNSPRPVFISLSQFAEQLGISVSTIRRRLRKLGVRTPGHALSPDEQSALRRALGAQTEPMSSAADDAAP